MYNMNLLGFKLILLCVYKIDLIKQTIFFISYFKWSATPNGSLPIKFDELDDDY